MTETVVAPPRGLELYGTGSRRVALPYGGKKAEGLATLGIDSVQDLLQHYPRYHVDRRELRTVRQVFDSWAPDQEVQILARVVDMGRPVEIGKSSGKPAPGKRRRRKTLIKATIGDDTGTIKVTWFNQDWVTRALAEGTEAFFYGKLKHFRGRIEMTSPRFEVLRSGKEPFNVGRIIPIYPATAELSTDALRRMMWETLESVGDILDPLPEEMRTKLHLMTRGEAIRLIHFPESRDDVLGARKRIVFDELFSLQLGLVYRKRRLERTVQGISHPHPAADGVAETFLRGLPFEPTAAQRRACDEIASDLVRSCPMHRLLEGEVGSGKTVVALYACLAAVEGRRQAAIMAPTEVLAEQHLLTVNELLDRAFGPQEARNLFATVSRRPVVRLLTGSTPASERAAILAAVATGEVGVVIGTHALIQQGVEFHDLGIAVVDEQHRFGVHQRRALRDKAMGAEPDILVMTATPIPRTLAVTIYGDLDISILDELPHGRRPTETSIACGPEDRARAYELIRREVGAGRQAFVVYALREDSDKTELRSAKAEAVRLAAEVFPDLSVGLVHGDMRAADKEKAMAEFRAGQTDVLVATTVIEVGVDVPNATVMLVEDAERFGLAQLHQLRGRVGRGSHRSFCILGTDLARERAVDDTGVALAYERLEALTRSSDGFELAEIDLRQRGEGQLFGARQSGLPDLKLARVTRHQDVIARTRELASTILDDDPELGEWEHLALAREVNDRFAGSAVDVVQSG